MGKSVSSGTANAPQSIPRLLKSIQCHNNWLEFDVAPLSGA